MVTIQLTREMNNEVFSLCGIAGFCDFTKDLRDTKVMTLDTIQKMGSKLNRRGPDDHGIFIDKYVAFAHTRLAVIDPLGGAQPMKKKIGETEFIIIYNGELYNTEEIRSELIKKGYTFNTATDTEVLLTAYIEYGVECVHYLNGIFAFAVWDSYHKRVFLCRDRFGVKPLFYTILNECFIFASEIKSLFEYKGVEPVINQNGLCEIFGLGPARSPGCGVYQGIHDLPPANAILIDHNGLKKYCYWELEAKEHKENYAETVEHTREILYDAISRQLVSDVPICTLLSGGIDSSVISAVAAKQRREQGKTLDTFSFDFEENEKHFKATDFQPSLDRPYVDIMKSAIGSRHHFLECSQSELADCLYDAVLAKDLPGMADVDSSLLYFSKLIKQTHTVSLSGECADEIFGGYPWFRNLDPLKNNRFPWSPNLQYRKKVISEDIEKHLPLEEYVESEFYKSLERMPKLKQENNEKNQNRFMNYLNITWFMTTLLDRKDRMTMYNGLEVRVPFADHRLVQYLYNVPWEFKYHNQEVKGLLKDVAKDILPKAIITRKKCPYPKTYHPQYEKIIKMRLNDILNDTNAPLNQLINVEFIQTLLNADTDYKIPWFGQLMATPQLYAYLIQINYWLVNYKVVINL